MVSAPTILVIEDHPLNMKPISSTIHVGLLWNIFQKLNLVEITYRKKNLILKRIWKRMNSLRKQ